MIQEGFQKAGDNRLLFIDKALGIAIILVVYGHILFRETESLNWFHISEKFIYHFHMSLFMCLSGYIAFLSASSKALMCRKNFLDFQKRKFRKFFPVYVIFSIFSMLTDVFYFHKSFNELSNSIYSFFFSPVNSSAEFVWYIYVLMGFYLITPFLINIRANLQYLLFAFSFLLTNAKFDIEFSSNLFARFFFFFFMGGLIYKNMHQFLLLSKRYGKFILIITMLLSLLYIPVDTRLPYQLLSFMMILSILYLSNFKWPNLITRIITIIGKNSFAIYILNTTLIHLYYIFYKAMISNEIGSFFIFSCVLFTIILSLFFRFIFKKIIPSRIYVL